MKPHWKQVRCEFNLYLLYEENEAMKPHWKQVKSEFNLYPLYEENDVVYMIKIHFTTLVYRR